MGRISILSPIAIGRGWILCMPRMPDWGEFRIGVDISEPNTPIGDGEGAALQLFQLQLVVAGAGTEIHDRLFDVGQRQTVGVAHHRHHQAAFGRNRDADIG